MIFYIHGANSSPTSFAFIKARLGDHDFEDVSYNHQRSISFVIDELSARVNEDSILIGHSLGGVIAVAVSHLKNVKKVISIASPFGGSTTATALKWVLPNNLFFDICHNSSLVKDIIRKGAVVPTISIVTTGSRSLFLNGENDMVVTLESQKSLKGATYHTIYKNHFEVLLCENVANIIRQEIQI